MNPFPIDVPIRIGVSSCLLGNEVRYDGGHKRNRLLTDTLGLFVQWVPVCPEFELGLGVPRDPIRLVRNADGIRLVSQNSGTDHTEAMRAWAWRRILQLERLGICGFVLKKNSPSCGMGRVRIYCPSGISSRRGRGLFAGELMRRLASLPVEEEDRLNDPRLRENFMKRVIAYRRRRGRQTRTGFVARRHSQRSGIPGSSEVKG